MQVERVILLVFFMLSISMLTGCAPKIPPVGDSLTAKEFWDMIKPVGDTLGNDIVPVYIIGSEYPSKHPKIHEGKAYRWRVGLYSYEEKTVWEVRYLSYRTEGRATPMPGSPGKRCDGSLTASDLADWKIDSPEASSMVDNSNVYFDPKIIPESTKIFWSIEAGDFTISMLAPVNISAVIP